MVEDQKLPTGYYEAGWRNVPLKTDAPEIVSAALAVAAEVEALRRENERLRKCQSEAITMLTLEIARLTSALERKNNA